MLHSTYHCQVWDLGGQTSIRPYWRCYYPNTDAIIFVVDSADVERLNIARQELSAMLEVGHRILHVTLSAYVHVGYSRLVSHRIPLP